LISQAQLEDRLLSGISKNDFTLRLLRAVGRNKQDGQSTATHNAEPVLARSQASEHTGHSAGVQPSNPAIHTTPSVPVLSEGNAIGPSTSGTMRLPATTVEDLETTAATPTASANAVQRMLNDRRVRLEADQKAKEAAQKAERLSKEKARKQAATEAESSDLGAAKSSKLTYAQEQIQRKKQDKSDRERVLRQLEMDKLERREREERRKAAAKAEASVGGEVKTQNAIDRAIQGQGSCSIQVRVVDGSTIRKRFAETDTLATTVRQWIDQTREDATAPYTFKQILTPMPNRTLSTTDEHKTLEEIGLLPSATLVLVPVPGYSEAYGRRRGGAINTTLSLVYGYTIAIISGIINAIMTFLGQRPAVNSSATNPTSQVTPSDNSESVSAGKGLKRAAGSVKIRTLRDQEADRDDQQLYNGNQVSSARRQ